jgi:hypothetical protein
MQLEKGDVTFTVEASNNLGTSTSDATEDPDITAHLEAFASDGCHCGDVKDKANRVYEFLCPDILINDKALRYKTYCWNDMVFDGGSTKDGAGWTMVARIHGSQKTRTVPPPSPHYTYQPTYMQMPWHSNHIATSSKLDIDKGEYCVI